MNLRIVSFFKKLRFTRETQIFIGFSILIFLSHMTLHGWKPLDKGYSIFYLDEEYTIATMFTSAIALLTGVLFLARTKVIAKFSEFLAVLATGSFFIMLALDEYLSLHENFNSLIKDHGKFDFVSELASNSWIYSLIIFIVAIVALLIYMISKENVKHIKASYILGLFFFITVLVLEAVGSNLYGKDIYVLVIGFEELSEMIGITFFLNGIMLKRFND